jgi:hypothetical protein
MSYLFGQTGIKDLKAIQEAAKGSSGSQGSVFQKLLNFLGSEDQKQFDASGKVIPTNTIIPTVGTDLIFKDQNQLKKVFNIDQKTKDPITEIITATTEGGDTTGGDGKKPGGIMGDMWGTTYDDYIAGQKDLFKEMAQEGYRLGAMKRLPDLAHAAFGGSYATALQPGMANLAQVASNSRPYQFNAPTIRRSSINFASLLG